MVGLLNALPNTQLWRRLKTEGRLLKESLGDSTLADVNFIPQMGIKELIEGYRRIFETIYQPHEYFDRVQAFLSRVGTSAQTPVAPRDLLAVARSLWRQGIRSHYRKEYWKFLLHAARRHRRHLGKALALAIMGHHFFELTATAVSKLD